MIAEADGERSKSRRQEIRQGGEQFDRRGTLLEVERVSQRDVESRNAEGSLTELASTIDALSLTVAEVV